MLGPAIRLLAAAGLAVAALPSCWELLRRSWLALPWPPSDALPLAVGAAAGILVVLWRRPNWLIHTIIHELCHVVACILLLVGFYPLSFRASNGRGGSVEHARTDPVRGTLIQIAPYTLPLLLAPALLVRQFIPLPAPWPEALGAAIAFLYAHHLQALYHNVRLNISGDQADLVKVGRPLALVLIAAALLLVTAWTLRVLARA